MDVRLFLSTLASADAHRAATRGLLVACVTGYVLTLVVLAAAGAGLSRWFFALLVWTLLVYMPLRIGLEAMQTAAPALRRRLVARAAGQSDRYAGRASIELLVDGLFTDAVVMPRIATPAQRDKAKAGAVAVLTQLAGLDAAGMHDATARCLATVERWMADLSGWSAAHAPANIQARWSDLRALAGLIGTTKIIVAAYRDRLGRPFAAGAVDGEGAEAYLDTCLDFCDRLAIDVDVARWEELPLELGVDPERRDALRAAWRAYHNVPPPAAAQRQGFVDAVLDPGSRIQDRGS